MRRYIFSIRIFEPVAETGRFVGRRDAVVGPATIATVEAAIARVKASPETAAAIREAPEVRAFVEGRCPEGGCFVNAQGSITDQRAEVPRACRDWAVCIGDVGEVLP